MKKILIILLLLANFCNLSIAQSEFTDGYIITNENDTLNGMIDNRGEILNSFKCRFKISEEAEIIEYEPGEILAYRFLNDKFYISKELPTENSKNIKFMEYLLNGVVDLYLLREVYGPRYFIETEDQPLTELREDKIEIHRDGKVYLKESKKYLGILLSMFNQAPELSSKIESLRLSRNSLVKLSESYHNIVCPDQGCVIYKKEQKRFQMTASITGGMMREHIIHDQGALDWKNYFNFNNLEPLTTSGIGLAFQIISPYNQRLFFQIEPYIYKSHYISSSTYYLGQGNTIVIPYQTNYTNLYCSFYLRYNILKTKVRPVFFGGINLNGSINFTATGFPVNENNFNKFISFGYSTGLGVSYQIAENKEISLRLLYHHLKDVLLYMNSNNYSLTLAVPIFTL